MDETSCKNCAHFCQHYTFDKKRIFRVHCGHCTFLTAKRKLPDSKICENFVPAEPDEHAFATKEYMTKSLLQYLLNLELLPQIEDMEKPGRSPKS